MSDTYVDPYAQYVNPTAGAPPPTPSIAPQTGAQINQVESGGNPNAKNPNSSAAGLGGFIDSTWLSMMNKYRPDLTQGKTNAQILSLRNDPKLSAAMTNAYAADNSEALTNAGQQATPSNIYLAHFAGPGGATAILKANPDTPVSQILSPDAIKANPQIANMTAGQIQQWAAGKMQPQGGTPEGYYGGALHLTIRPQDVNADPYSQYAQGDNSSTSAINAFGRGAASGLTANFYDELRGLHVAGGGDPNGTFSIPSIVKGAYLLGTGDKGASQAYQDTAGKERQAEQQAQEQHPAASLAGNIGGALMFPVGAGAGAATLPARMVRGAAVGGAYGALYGAGEGENPEDRLSRAASGGVVGAAGGAAAPAVMAGVAPIAGKVLGYPIKAYRAATQTDQEAAKRIGGALRYDVQSGRGGMSAADLAAAQANGQPTALMDIGGEGTRALARSAANTSPAARSAIEEMTQDRFRSQSSRVADFIRNLVPTPGNATRTQEALDTAARAANKPAYKRAYQAGDRPIISDELERLMGSPDVVSAMKQAAEKGKSRAIAEGFGAFNPGVKVTDDGRVIFNKGKNGVPTYPNIQFWDYTYRSLRDAGNAAFRAGRNDEGNYLSTLSKQLRSELDSQVPEYGQARAGAASFFGAENALEAGQKFVTMRGSLEEARQAIGKMSGPERSLFAEGFVSDLADKISKVPENRSVIIDRIFNSPDGKARINMALGPGRAGEVEAYMRRENMMDQARKALGNSTTARQLQEMALAAGIGGGAEGFFTGDWDMKTIITSALLGSVAAGHSAINAKLAQRVGEMLASNDPKDFIPALRMAANNPKIGGAVRRAETLLEKIGGSSAGKTPPMLPTAIPANANQQQQ